jgi:hypothetical protein
MKLSNLIVERAIKLIYSLLTLFIGVRVLENDDFLILQQIVLFQSILVFAINLPYTSIIQRLSQRNLKFLPKIYFSIIFLRIILIVLALIGIATYLSFSGFENSEILIILIGQIPGMIVNIFLIDLIPHILDFEGKKNWQVVFVYLFFLFLKIAVLLIIKSLIGKIIIETIEGISVLMWCYFNYLKGNEKPIINGRNLNRIKKLSLLSAGLYINGIFSVFIVRVDQLMLVGQLNKQDLSNYMLIGSIVSLFMIPLNLLGERIGFTLNNAKVHSFENFKLESQKVLFVFLCSGVLLFIFYFFTFEKIAFFIFNRNIKNLFLPGLILGISIVINSIGMILGQVNVILNGGYFTMLRTGIGSVIMVVLISIGYKTYGVFGVTVASLISLILTNILFWFLSSKIRKVLS